MLKKKLIKLTVSLSSLFLCIQPIIVNAEEGDNPCGNIQSDADKQACDAYNKQLEAENKDYAAQLAEINAKRKEIAADISKYNDTLKTYQSELKTLNSKIDELNTKISAKQAEIDETQTKADEKQVEIDENQAKIDELSEKAKTRMVTSQSGMRINKMFSVLMGASTFTDFIRIVNGINDITASDEETNAQLVTLSKQLREDKQELEDLKTSLETQKQELETAQEEVNVDKQNVALKQAEIQVIKDAAEDSAAEMEAQGNTVAENISDVKSTISANASAIEEYQKKLEEKKKAEEAAKKAEEEKNNSSNDNSSDSDSTTPSGNSGWSNPVPGAYRSAGTWNYSGGGKHLGMDFAASEGTTIRAAGDGYVINSANGCSVGYLGSTCHGTGGSNGGGNQVYLLTTVNGSLYAVKYLHMQLNSPVAKGTWVSAGDYVGRVGATGNVTGAHCHIEVFYLGDAENFSNYLYNWNGDLAFGCGWAGSYDGYGRRCSSYGAPCRVRPESVFGY